MAKSMKIKNLHIGSHIILVIWSMIVIFPIYVMVSNSFKSRLGIYKNPFGLPKTWHFSNYSKVLSDGDFLRYFQNTFVVVLLSLFFVLLLGSLAAYALAHARGKIFRIIFYVIIAGMMLPIKIASVRILALVKALGLLNTIWSLIPVYVAMGIPIAVFVLTEFIRAIPMSLTEAALLDGAKRLTIFRIITVPLIRPALATVAIYNLVPFWNDLWFPLIFITDEKAKTLLLGVTRLFGQYQTDWAKVMAVLTLSAIPVLILYILLSKQFIKGLTAGAVKG